MSARGVGELSGTLLGGFVLMDDQATECWTAPFACPDVGPGAIAMTLAAVVQGLAGGTELFEQTVGQCSDVGLVQGKQPELRCLLSEELDLLLAVVSYLLNRLILG